MGCALRLFPPAPVLKRKQPALINYLIYNAERRITICSPYFVPEETLLQALTNAAYSGIETTVIVCEKGDQFRTEHGAAFLL